MVLCIFGLLSLAQKDNFTKLLQGEENTSQGIGAPNHLSVEQESRTAPLSLFLFFSMLWSICRAHCVLGTTGAEVAFHKG